MVQEFMVDEAFPKKVQPCFDYSDKLYNRFRSKVITNRPLPLPLERFVIGRSDRGSSPQYGECKRSRSRCGISVPEEVKVGLWGRIEMMQAVTCD